MVTSFDGVTIVIGSLGVFGGVVIFVRFVNFGFAFALVHDDGAAVETAHVAFSILVLLLLDR